LKGQQGAKGEEDEEEGNSPKVEERQESKPSATSTSSTAGTAEQKGGTASPSGTARADLPEHKRLALEEKEKGNQAYSQKRFEEAIKHYTAAIEADKEDMVYQNNLGAVYFEMGNYEDCIKACQEAINTGRYNFADFKLISKAYHRMGNAYTKLENYDEAIKAYNSALTEHRNPDSLASLRRAEKLKEKKRY